MLLDASIQVHYSESVGKERQRVTRGLTEQSLSREVSSVKSAVVWKNIVEQLHGGEKGTEGRERPLSSVSKHGGGITWRETRKCVTSR